MWVCLSRSQLSAGLLNFRELVPSELSAELARLINLCLSLMSAQKKKKRDNMLRGFRLAFNAGSIDIVNHQGVYFNGLV